MIDYIGLLEKEQRKKELVDFRPGDLVRVHVKIKEGDKERIQDFQGIVIARRGSGANETFTVRKISDGVGVERIFPVHSPRIAQIDLVKSGRVRRSKLYYIRSLAAKAVAQKTTA